jgi:Caspase domain
VKKRALLVGSQVDGLGGVENDVSMIGERLRARGFDVDVRIRGDASRAGILEGYARLIRDSGPGDAALAYYSGHGCRLENSEPRAGEPSALQFLVPTDWSQAGVFRGIVDTELSERCRELTERTQNVVQLLDCCHAATMVRGNDHSDDERVAKFTQRRWGEALRDHLSGLQVDTTQLAVESNPLAVRLSASELDRVAFESVHELDGRRLRMGNFSWALVTVLDELGSAHVSFRALMARVRELVMRLAPQQCPQLEGPGDRLVFGTELLPRHDALVFFRDAQGVPKLRGSRLLGAVPGAVYDLMPSSSSAFTATEAIATATVAEDCGATARVELADIRREPQSGDLAYPRTRAYRRLRVTVEGDGALQRPLRERVNASAFLCEAGTAAPELVLREQAGTLRLLDDGGNDVVRPPTCALSGVSAAIATAERLSRARALMCLETEGFAAPPVRVEWGRVEGGQRVPLEAAARVYLGDHLYVDVTNLGAAPLWLAVFDVGVTGQITLLTSATPTGRKLREAGQADARYVLGERFGTLRGVGPAALPSDAPQVQAELSESLVLLVTPEPTDFFLFETPHERGETRGGVGGLAALLEQLRRGGTRDLASEQQASRFYVQRIGFSLAPTARTPTPGGPP